MKKFVLSCTSSNPDYNADFDVAFLSLDAEHMGLIQQRLVRVKEARKVDPELWETYFWDTNCIDFYELSLNPFDDEDSEDALLGGQSYLVSETRPAPRVKPEPHRVECVQMIVDADYHVRWTCIPKHSAIFITTENLPL